MSIEINELVVNATIDDSQTANYKQSKDDLYLKIGEIKAQIFSECKSLFNEMLDKQGER